MRAFDFILFFKHCEVELERIQTNIDVCAVKAQERAFWSKAL